MASINRPLFNREMATAYRAKIGAKLREARMAAGLTQNEVGKLLGVIHTEISAIEMGRSPIAGKHYKILVEALGLHPVEFGKFMLRYTNPWLYALIYGNGDPTLQQDLKNAAAIEPVRQANWTPTTQDTTSQSPGGE